MSLRQKPGSSTEALLFSSLIRANRRYLIEVAKRFILWICTSGIGTIAIALILRRFRLMNAFGTLLPSLLWGSAIVEFQRPDCPSISISRMDTGNGAMRRSDFASSTLPLVDDFSGWA